MRHYVCGFLFDSRREIVALIRKNKPEWQHGLLNGIGGKIENDEGALHAMQREFQEETGASVKDWTFILRLRHTSKNPEWIVWFFKAFEFHSIKTQDFQEPVDWYKVSDIVDQLRIDVVPNLKWLLPLAMESIHGELIQTVWPHKE